MHVFFTGVTGFLGAALAQRLLDEGHSVSGFVRSPARARQKLPSSIALIDDLSAIAGLPKIDVVINLAGENIAGERWTRRYKQRLLDSRVALTDKLIESLKAAGHRPAVFVSSSATGYYERDHGTPCIEADPAGNDFAAELCLRWEKAAQRASSELGSRVVLLRTGLVLGRDGGPLKAMVPMFRKRIGGRIGDGKQGMAWIHLDDWIASVLFLLADKRAAGAYNLVTPASCSNREFVAALAAALGMSVPLPTPAIAVKLAMGEASALLLNSLHVKPERLQAAGFTFRYTDIDEAMKASIR